MELNVEVIEKLNVGTAGGWLERMVRRTCHLERERFLWPNRTLSMPVSGANNPLTVYCSPASNVPSCGTLLEKVGYAAGLILSNKTWCPGDTRTFCWGDFNGRPSTATMATPHDSSRSAVTPASEGA